MKGGRTILRDAPPGSRGPEPVGPGASSSAISESDGRGGGTSTTTDLPGAGASRPRSRVAIVSTRVRFSRADFSRLSFRFSSRRRSFSRLQLHGGQTRSADLESRPGVKTRRSGDDRHQEDQPPDLPPGPGIHLADHFRVVHGLAEAHDAFVVSHAASSRASPRSRALRALGFSRVSSSEGLMGFRFRRAKPRRASSRKVVFTTRSSRLWNAMTTRRPAGLMAGRQGLEDLTQAVELPVDVYAQGLERARGGMEAPTAAPGRGAPDDVRQLGRGSDGLAVPGPHDAPGDGAGGPLLSESVDEVRQLGLRCGVDHLRGRGPATSVHAHVEGSLGLEAEAPGRIVQLG